MKNRTINIGITDDHRLFVKSLSLLINSFISCKVIIEASSGRDLVKKMELAETKPDILLIDVNMPEMDGVATTQKIMDLYPEIKAVALSMKEDDSTIINMIKAGCCA